MPYDPGKSGTVNCVHHAAGIMEASPGDKERRLTCV